MKNHSVDPIQIFCMNFKCDIDLRLPPGGPPRYIASVIWPSFEDLCKNKDSSFNDRKIQYQLLEILLKNSRYSIETIQLVLAEPKKYTHLEKAILNYYSKINSDEFFHSEQIIDALKLLQLFEFDNLSREELIDSVKTKLNNWLDKAIIICKG